MYNIILSRGIAILPNVKSFTGDSSRLWQSVEDSIKDKGLHLVPDKDKLLSSLTDWLVKDKTQSNALDFVFSFDLADKDNEKFQCTIVQSGEDLHGVAYQAIEDNYKEDIIVSLLSATLQEISLQGAHFNYSLNSEGIEVNLSTNFGEALGWEDSLDDYDEDFGDIDKADFDRSFQQFMVEVNHQLLHKEIFGLKFTDIEALATKLEEAGIRELSDLISTDLVVASSVTTLDIQQIEDTYKLILTQEDKVVQQYDVTEYMKLSDTLDMKFILIDLLYLFTI